MSGWPGQNPEPRSVSREEEGITKRDVTPQQLHEAREQQKKTGRRLGAVLAELGHLSEEQVTGLVAKQYGLIAVNDLDTREVAPEVLKLVPRARGGH